MKRRPRREKWLFLCVATFVLICMSHFGMRNITDEPCQVSVSRPIPAQNEEHELVQEPEWPKTLLPGERIDLNQAPVKDLTRVPQIGRKRAEAIVAWREENGGFQKPEELMKVSGIGEGIFAQVERYITVSDGQ